MLQDTFSIDFPLCFEGFILQGAKQPLFPWASQQELGTQHEPGGGPVLMKLDHVQPSVT